jgi:2-hydroxy-6-oxonona-2,4-dienedioate hydrolase
MVATLLTDSYPHRTERLVMVGGPALSTRPTRPLGLRAWSHLPEGPARLAIIRHNMAILMVSREESIDDVALTLHAENLRRDRMHGRKLSQTDIVLRLLPSLACPVFGIWGREDALYLGRQHTIEPALAHAPHFKSLVMIEGAGHWVQYESPDAFNDALIPMLA